MEDDPYALLEYDPASVAIRASHNRTTLEKLSTFTTQLARYVDMAIEQQGKHNESDSDTGQVRPCSGVHKDESKLVPKEGSAKNQKTDRQSPTTNIVSPDRIVSSASRAVQARQDSSRFDPEIPDSGTAKNETLGNSSLSDERSVSPFDFKSGASEFNLESQDHVHPTPDLTPPKQKRPCPAANQLEPFGKRTKPHGYRGTLRESILCRSKGKTREVLNEYLPDLGLTACFVQGVVSKRFNIVSHLTFNHDWNDLPYDMSETFQWWVGEGPRRLKLASPLNPSVFRQPESGHPIFWACSQPHHGGALCHYIGHFRCVRFEKIRKVVKKIPRQALLEFKFVRFDASLSDKISQIP